MGNVKLVAEAREYIDVLAPFVTDVISRLADALAAQEWQPIATGPMGMGWKSW